MRRDKSVYKRMDRINWALKRAYQLYKSGLLSLGVYSICCRVLSERFNKMWKMV